MPRRCTEVVAVAEPPRKKNKVVIEEPPNLDASYFDDEALLPGKIFTDVQQKQWRLGKPIGRGSFGRIYLASDEIDKEITKLNARYVVKIEPHTNGPLFVEIHCLIRIAQAAKVNEWRSQKKQKHFGMPVYIANGSFTDEASGVKYRFLVLPRFDIDLHKIMERTRVLDPRNILILAIQILDVLEYLHSQGYTHSDIKSSNLMLGFDGQKLGRPNFVKPAPSFQKDTKELAVLSGKHRKAKTSGKARHSYYDDEDFIVKDYKSGFNECEKDKKLATAKNNLRKILKDRDSRTLHRHHALNLRQLPKCVNYEDMTSSICSDQSYQKLLGDFKRQDFSSDEGFHEDPKLEKKWKDDEQPALDVFREAVLTQSPGQIYLLDYGLASKFLDAEGNHKDFGMDARKAHDGTLEYSSRDSHIGAHSRRSDLETLGYNLLDWLTGVLPWKTAEMLAEPDLVHALKKNFMSDVKSLLKACFKSDYYPQFMESYLEYVTTLDFTERPDYNYCRSIFRAELAKSGHLEKELALKFVESPMSPMSRKKLFTNRFGRKNAPGKFLAKTGPGKSYERENISSLENDLMLELLKQTLNSSSDGVRKPCSSRNFFISDADLVARLKKSLMPHDVLGKKLSPKYLRSNRKQTKRRAGKRHRSSIGKFGNFMGSARQFTWAEILAGNPEDIIRKERNATSNDEDDDDDNCKYRIRKLSNASAESNCDNTQSPLLQKDYLQSLNPTYAMKEVIANFKRKIAGKTEDEVDGIEGYTPAMVHLYRVKQKRELKEKSEAKVCESKNRKASRKTEVVVKTDSAGPVDIRVKDMRQLKEKSESKAESKVRKASNRDTVEVPKRVTRQTVSDTAETEQSKTKNRKVSPKSKNTKVNAESTKVNVENDKQKVENVKISKPSVEDPKPVTRNTKATSVKRVSAARAVTNRRKLRSSRRNKN